MLLRTTAGDGCRARAFRRLMNMHCITSRPTTAVLIIAVRKARSVVAGAGGGGVGGEKRPKGIMIFERRC
jgi:hypothetical protein